MSNFKMKKNAILLMPNQIIEIDGGCADSDLEEILFEEFSLDAEGVIRRCGLRFDYDIAHAPFLIIDIKSENRTLIENRCDPIRLLIGGVTNIDALRKYCETILGLIERENLRIASTKPKKNDLFYVD